MRQRLRSDQIAGHFPHRMSGENTEKGLFAVMGKKFSEAVLTCDLEKPAVVFLIFLKADKHQLNGFVFHVIFNHDFDLAADIPIEQELDHFIFILKIIIESRADHMSTIRDHFDGYLLKRHGKHKCPKAVCQ